MSQRYITFLLVLLMLGISSTTVFAQRGGGRGFGRGGPVSMRGHSPGAKVFVGPQFSPNGRFINNFGTRGNFNPFFGKPGRGVFTRVHRGFPIFFFSNDGLHFNNIESGLGAGIPPIAMTNPAIVTPILPVRSSFLGVHLKERPRPPIRTVIDLPPFGHVGGVKLGDVKSSRAVIIILPTNTFGDDNRRTIGSVPK